MKGRVKMKQIVPFTKEILFKSTIGELTSISLDHDLQLKGEDLITGNFYIKGKYKLTKASQLEEDFSYKVPCEIAISDDYDTFDAVIDIDDFYYSIVEEEILKVNISVSIDNLVRKENVVETKEEEVQERSELEEKLDFEEEENIEENIEEEQSIEEKPDLEDKVVFKDSDERENISPINIIKETNQQIFNETNEEEVYSTYYVYLVQDDDTFERIGEKYHCSKEEILLYNDVKELKAGIKLVIPETNNG